MTPASPPGGHKTPHPLAAMFFQMIMTIFELDRDIHKTNVLTKFNNDCAKNVTSRENANPPPSGGHVFLPIQTIFKLNRHIQKTNVLTKCHEDWTKNVTARKTAPPLCGHVFSNDHDHF
ncbi:hypothetical protein DPMN_164214 [Dreissena polymorpha]|uniref:Uncharacterized protein n=1 Tax=Dreissena polymorpha TaxID=45954 RepID=A0A9D4IVD6_DREPO|nr:hypothetical protein DPMN_164214 [Dreissena polymorpha]